MESNKQIMADTTNQENVQRPLVSIIIPVFNQKIEYFRRCIQSALDQNDSDVEVIVSDNHSTNGCSAVPTEFSDPRIRLVRPPRHLSIVQHFAYAAFQANGEFLSFLPSDDWLDPDWFSKMVSAMRRHPEASFAYCDIFRHDQQSGETHRYRGSDFPSQYLSDSEAIHVFGKMISKDTSGYIVGALIRSDSFFRCGGLHDAGAMYAGDLTIGFGLLKYGGVVYVGEPLVNYTAWPKIEGKMTESKWRVVTCQDTAKILAWARNDLLLMEIAKRAGFSFMRARARMSFFFLLSYIQMAIDERDNTELLDSFQKVLKLLSNGWLPIWFTSIFRGSLVSGLMDYLRSRLGPKVKSMFL